MDKQTISYRGYEGSIETSIEDDCLHGKILFINDIITYEAETIPALKTAFQEAVERYLDYCQTTGRAPDKTYSGSFNVRVGSDRHKSLARIATQQAVSINEVVCQAVDKLTATSGEEKHFHIHIGVNHPEPFLLSNANEPQWRMTSNVATTH